MTDTNQLPEPELGYIKTDKSNQPAFSARQMREAVEHALQARAQVQGEPSWWMRETDEGAEWTDTAPLVLSGWTPLYTTPQPAQAPQAEVTDAGIEQVLTLAHSYADAKLMRYGALGIKEPPDPAAAFSELRRAILALRPELVPMTDEQISFEAHNADDRDWNDLRFRRSWHEGFLEGARFAEAHHGIKPKEQA